MKLLDTNASNTKLAKTLTKASGTIRIASLSMMPTRELCPGSKAAGCFDSCLKSAGRGRFNNVSEARQRKTDYWNSDREGFLSQLDKELQQFAKLCDKQGVQGVVRLNVLSDIPWEQYGIIDNWPQLQFFDYTKLAKRLDNTPSNYNLIFSYSGRPEYQRQVKTALKYARPIAVVFNGEPPQYFLGRPVVDGDASDWDNVQAKRCIVALKAKGKAKTDTSGFVVDATNAMAQLIARDALA